MSDYNKNILSKISKNLENCVDLLDQEGAGRDSDMATELKQLPPLTSEEKRDSDVVRAIVTDGAKKTALAREAKAVQENKNQTQVSVLAKINDLLQKLNPISAEVANRDGDYHTTKSQMKAKNLNNVQEVNSAADAKEEELRGLQKEAIDVDEKIRAVERKLEEAREQNEQLTSLSQNFRNKISNEMTEMEGILQSVEKEAGNEGENLRLNGINDELDGLLTLIGGGRPSTVADATTFKQNVTDFLNRKKAIARKLNDLKGKIPLLLENFNKVIGSKGTMDRLNTTSKQVSELNSDITDLNQQLAKTEGDLSDMEAENSRLESDSKESTKTANNIMGNLNTRMDTMNSLMSSVDLDMIEGNVDRLSKTVDAIEANMGYVAPGPAATPPVSPERTDTGLSASSESDEDEDEDAGEINAEDRFKYQYKFVKL